MKCPRVDDRGLITMTSPAPNLRKVKRVSENSIAGSHKNIRMLSKIEEKKSENYSGDNLNQSEVSSVREAIINFDTEIQKIR